MCMKLLVAREVHTVRAVDVNLAPTPAETTTIVFTPKSPELSATNAQAVETLRWHAKYVGQSMTAYPA